jgi:hypothetical protein
MGLKGYRLWDMGQLDSNVQSPTVPRPRQPVHGDVARRDLGQDVALQVAFERQTLKPIFSFDRF